MATAAVVSSGQIASHRDREDTNKMACGSANGLEPFLAKANDSINALSSADRQKSYGISTRKASRCADDAFIVLVGLAADVRLGGNALGTSGDDA